MINFLTFEPEGGYDSAPVAEGDVTPVSVGVLVSRQFAATDVLVCGGDDPHHVLVRLQVAPIQLAARLQRIKAGPDVLTADFSYFATERDFMNFVSEVVSVWLDIHGVSGQVKVAGDFVDVESCLEQTSLVAERSLDCVLHKADLMSPHVVLSNIFSMLIFSLKANLDRPVCLFLSIHI